MTDDFDGDFMCVAVSGMEVAENGGGPAVLQLHRWNPSHIRFDLCEYREAFLSPTRELLLFLSYQNEALLLPLSRGDNILFVACFTNLFNMYSVFEPFLQVIHIS